jgi:YebC/PmpR family DNA-binding regulatory protein
MSGHSKWSSIKHKKAKVDAQRSKIFGRLIREIIVAARQGGGAVDANPRLRTAVSAAKEANVPMDNITRAVKKGTGELPGTVIEEFTYEGYAPGGVAVMVEIVTDNKNRTSSEIRKIFSKHGGNLGSAGCVSWLFDKRGVINISGESAEEEILMEIALESGAEDLKSEGGEYSIITPPENFEEAVEALKNAGMEPEFAQITMVPETLVKVEGKTAEQVLALAEELEEHPDTQNVHLNFDMPEEMLEN